MPSTSETADPTTDPTVGSLVWRLSIRWRAAVDRAIAPLGLTHAQYMVLASLHGLTRARPAADPPPTQRQLADYAQLEPIYVSKLVRALARARLLERTEHPTDARAVQLRLTEHGAETADVAIATVRRLQEDLTAPIGGTGAPRHAELVATLRLLLRQRAGTAG